MLTTRPSSADVGRRGNALYEQKIRALVETPENIGKMCIIDLATEEFEIDELGLAAARTLQDRHPDAVLYGKKIGYNAAVALGGVLERTAK